MGRGSLHIGPSGHAKRRPEAGRPSGNRERGKWVHSETAQAVAIPARRGAGGGCGRSTRARRVLGSKARSQRKLCSRELAVLDLVVRFQTATHRRHDDRPRWRGHVRGRHGCRGEPRVDGYRADVLGERSGQPSGGEDRLGRHLHLRSSRALQVRKHDAVRGVHEIRNRGAGARQHRRDHDGHDARRATTTTGTITTGSTTPSYGPSGGFQQPGGPSAAGGAPGSPLIASGPAPVELGAIRHGRALRGSLDLAPAAAGSRLEVELLATRASLASAAGSARVRVGRLTRSSLPAGVSTFTVALNAAARHALQAARAARAERRDRAEPGARSAAEARSERRRTTLSGVQSPQRVCVAPSDGVCAQAPVAPCAADSHSAGSTPAGTSPTIGGK